MSIFAGGKNGGRSANPTTKLIDTSRDGSARDSRARPTMTGKYQVRRETDGGQRHGSSTSHRKIFNIAPSSCLLVSPRLSKFPDVRALHCSRDSLRCTYRVIFKVAPLSRPTTSVIIFAVTLVEIQPAEKGYRDVLPVVESISAADAVNFARKYAKWKVARAKSTRYGGTNKLQRRMSVGIARSYLILDEILNCILNASVENYSRTIDYYHRF